MNKKIFFLFFSVIFYSSIFSQTNEIDSLINLSRSLEDNSEKVDIYNQLCWNLKSIDFNLSYEYGQKSVALSKKLKYNEGIALAYKNLGGILYLTNDYPNAFLYYDSSLTYYTQINDSLGISKITRNMGSVMHQQGNYDEAVEYFLKSLDIRKAMADEVAVADIYNALGLVFSEQGDAMFEKALENYSEALLTYQLIGDTTGQAESYNRIGGLYLNKKIPDIDSAIFYFNKFLEFANYLDNKRFIAQAKEGLALIAKSNGNIADAETKFLECEKIWIELGNNFSLSSVYNNLGELYYRQPNYEKALKYTLSANAISLSNDFPVIRQQSDTSLMKIYEKLGDNAKALYYAKDYIYLTDSLQGEEMKQAITRMEVKHEFEKKMQEQEQIQEKLNIEHDAQLKRQRIISVFILIGLVLMLGVVVLIFRSYKQKQKANQLLESKNKEISYKNEMLHQQNEEIEAQRDEIEKQRDTVIGQKDEIEKQKQNITDSIIYAKRIQAALLPPNEFINELFPNNFIIFKPRDIVSGDFYWGAQKENMSIITVADCTGHGVPGAFMSMLGISFLNEIVNSIEKDKLNAGLILTELRSYVKKSLRQTGKDNEAKDGMDISLCVFDYNKKVVHFSGAHNPLIQISKGELIHHKADRMPIGIYVKEKENFENTEIELIKDDYFYMFSDGFVDQFGGRDGKKFMIKNFKELLFENVSKSMEEQKDVIIKSFDNWLHDENLTHKFEQIDDVCIIGLQV